MLTYIFKRILLALLVAVTISAISFSLLRLSGDPAAAIAGASATDKQVEFVRKTYGFDRPIIVQYLDWLGKAVRFDFGISYYFKLPVGQILGPRMVTTLTLGICAFIFAMMLSIPLGVLAAMRPDSMIDRLTLILAVIGMAMPTFWFALMLVVLLSVIFPLLPPSGSESWKNFIMPTIALGYFATPDLVRLIRAGMLEVLESDYIRTARAKGLSTSQVVFKHALRNAAIPVVSLGAVQLGLMLGGSVVVETVFALHGMGYLAWETLSRSDFPTVQALVLVFSSFFIVLTLMADILNAWLDPRIRIL